MFPTPSSPFVDVYETVAAGWEFGLVLWGAGGFALLLGVVWGWKWVSRLFNQAAIAGGGGGGGSGGWGDTQSDDDIRDEYAFGEMLDHSRTARASQTMIHQANADDLAMDIDMDEFNRVYSLKQRNNADLVDELNRDGFDWGEGEDNS